MPLVGYVDVAYGGRPLPEVRADCRAWREIHGIDAVMLDCLPREPVRGHWTVDDARLLRADGVEVLVGNPGTTPCARAWELFDVLCEDERGWDDYRRTPQTRVEGAPGPALAWHLVHSCPDDRVAEALAIASARGASLAWVSRHAPPHPWGDVPPGLAVPGGTPAA